MFSASSKLVALAALSLLAVAPARPAGAAPQISFCIDSASPSAAYDHDVAKAAAAATGALAQFVTFDSRTGDDDGFDLRNFRTLAQERCNLVMGFPMEPGSDRLPKGLNHTRPYLETGFVLVTPQGLTLAQLPQASRVAVAYNTPANLFFVGQQRLTTIVYDDENQGLSALASGAVQAAAVWEPGVADYKRHHAAARGWQEQPIARPHAHWQLTALYLPRSADAAQRFEQGLKQLHPADPPNPVSHDDGKASDGYPRLFTAAQADQGAKLFAQHCAVCHGAKLQGIVGPTLKGEGFASADDDFTIGGMFSFFSQQMPAGQPGSLKKSEYAELMAFLLRENGYQAGHKELTYGQAQASQVPLVAHNKAGAKPQGDIAKGPQPVSGVSK